MPEDIVFPFDLCTSAALPDDALGRLIRSLEGISLYPPYPWGQWLYGQLFTKHCARLPGQVVECGVARGGMSIFLGYLAKDAGKQVLSLDSFRGLPPPSVAHDNPYFRQGDYEPAPDGPSVLARFEQSIRQHGLQHTVHPVPGFFAETLPTLDPKLEIGFLHIDADLYASVREVLEALYDRVVDGGVIVLDDFFHQAQGPARAAADFFHPRGIYPLYHVSFPYSVFLFKGHIGHLSTRYRSVDGNFYSLEFLRMDPALRAAVQRSQDRLERMGGTHQRALDNCRRLAALLQPGAARSSDIYAYWLALEEYWDDMCPLETVSTWRDGRPTIQL